jgi:3-oxoacyl-[acyl-carrier protein] reductase
LDVQLKGALLMAERCVPGMTSNRWGRVVNISSQVIDGAPSPGWTSYAVGKAALSMFSRYLAAELGPSGITVNNVSPGMTETPLIGDVPEKIQMMVARQTPLRRLATPDDVASAVVHLVSDEAGFVTGQTMRVNGGMAML